MRALAGSCHERIHLMWKNSQMHHYTSEMFVTNTKSYQMLITTNVIVIHKFSMLSQISLYTVMQEYKVRSSNIHVCYTYA